jgi:hypothetical protein
MRKDPGQTQQRVGTALSIGGGLAAGGYATASILDFLDGHVDPAANMFRLSATMVCVGVSLTGSAVAFHALHKSLNHMTPEGPA